MTNLRKLALAFALICMGPAIWSIGWSFFYPSFQIMYWPYYGEWTPATFQNYLILGIAGIYIIGFLLMAWKDRNIDLAPQPIDPPRRSETDLTSTASGSEQHRVSPSSSLPVSVSSPQLSEVMARLKELEERQAKIEPFLKLAPKKEGEQKQ